MNTLNTIALISAESLDHFRSWVLRKTLSIQALRLIFISRPKRLFFLFSLSTLIALGSSLFFPLWSLLIGPLIYGIPHLYASLRYTHASLRQSPHQSLRRSQIFPLLSSVFTLTTLVRLWMHSQSMTTDALPLGELLPEWISFTLTLTVCLLFYRTSPSQLLRSLFSSSLILLVAWKFPIEVAGLLMLAHHFVGFLFWISLSRAQHTEHRVALTCSLIFTLIHALIFCGTFDPLYSFFTPAGEIPWAHLEYSQLGQLILPHATQEHTWFHAVVAYSFGQSMHYFIWLKALADQNHHHTTSPSFRQSLTLLLQDFNPFSLGVGVILSLCLFFIWGFINYPLARSLYFILASYHGFMELAACTFLPLRRTS